MLKWLLICVLFPAGIAIAQTDKPEKKFYAGLEMGAGRLSLSDYHQSPDPALRYALGVYGGYRPWPWMEIGLNVNGWLIEPYGYYDPGKGISISNTFVQWIVYPGQTQFFLQLQGGWSKYINHHPDRYNTKGYGMKAGLGYAFRLGKHIVVPLTVNYSTGKFNEINLPGISIQDQRFQVVEVLAGITFR